MIKFRLNTSDDWWRARFVSTGSSVAGLRADGAHALPYWPVSPLSHLLCFLHFPHFKQHLADVPGSVFRPLPESLGSDDTDCSRILCIDGGGTLQTGAGKIQRALYSGALGDVRQLGGFGRHLRHQFVASDPSQRGAAIKDYVLRFGYRARDRHRFGHLYRSEEPTSELQSLRHLV